MSELQVLERELTSSECDSLSAWEVHTAIQERLRDITPDLEDALGIVQTKLAEVAVPGPHRLLVLDETNQLSNNFKYNGAAIAVHRLLQERPELELFASGTAGNFGGALAAAVHNANLRDGARRRAVLFAPPTLLRAMKKKDTIERHGGEVRLVDGDVVDAIALAESFPELHANAAFVHPFNNIDAISGQALVGRRIAEGLRRHQVTGPVRVLVQRGGGSLIAGVSSVLKEANLPGVDLEVVEVRPELLGDGLDKRYDGLAVDKPGGFATPLLDPVNGFVARTVHVSEYDTGRAANRMAAAFHGKRYEPSGLAGAAAYEHLAPQAAEPTTYVVILSGANVDATVYSEFADAPRRQQREILGELALSRRSSTKVATSIGRPALQVWSGPTANL